MSSSRVVAPNSRPPFCKGELRRSQNVDRDRKKPEEAAVRRATLELWPLDRVSKGAVDNEKRRERNLANGRDGEQRRGLHLDRQYTLASVPGDLFSRFAVRRVERPRRSRRVGDVGISQSRTHPANEVSVGDRRSVGWQVVVRRALIPHGLRSEDGVAGPMVGLQTARGAETDERVAPSSTSSSSTETTAGAPIPMQQMPTWWSVALTVKKRPGPGPNIGFIV